MLQLFILMMRFDVETTNFAICKLTRSAEVLQTLTN